MAHRRNCGMKIKVWVTVGIIMFSFGGTALAWEWPIGTFYYKITRKTKHTGFMKIVSKREGDDVVAETEEWLDDTGYCHASKRREVWRSGTLISFESSTAGSCSGFVRLFQADACPWDEFGEPITVSIVRKDKALLETIGPEKVVEISGEAIPTNFLNPAFRGPDHTVQVISPITGEGESMIIENKGMDNLSIGNTSEKAERYVVQDQDGQNRELWYDIRGVWIRMFLQRHAVTFAAADPARTKSELTSFVNKSRCLRKLPNNSGK